MPTANIVPIFVLTGWQYKFPELQNEFRENFSAKVKTQDFLFHANKKLPAASIPETAGKLYYWKYYFTTTFFVVPSVILIMFTPFCGSLTRLPSRV